MLWETGAMLGCCTGDEGMNWALLVWGWAVIAVYALSAAAADLYASAFTSLAFFPTTGAILGHVSHLRSPRVWLQDAQARCLCA